MKPVLPRHPSVVAALFANAELGSDSPTFTFAMTPDDHRQLRHDDLAVAAIAVAEQLAARGVTAGDRVLLCVPTSPEFVIVFFAATLLGAVPVAMALPHRFGHPGVFAEGYRTLLGYLAPSAVVADASVVPELDGPAGVAVVDAQELTSNARTADGSNGVGALPDAAALAFVQLTSGSTGTPKGVMISHANVAANCEQLARSCGWSRADVQATWLPLNHDMGLIGTLLAPVFIGTSAVLLPPERFLRSPAEWLQVVSRYGGTLSAAPNFGFAYANARIRDEELEGVNLSSWRFVFCGAEPIAVDTLEAFTTRFGAWGLRPDALVPCYGLAEATLGVTVAQPRSPVRADVVSRQVLAEQRRVQPVETGDPAAQHVVNCGAPLMGTEIRIVDESGADLPDGSLGRVRFRGPSRTLGYYDLPGSTADALDGDGWWDTGDLGYVMDGELRVAGRAKEVLIIRGANFFPDELERASETVAGVRPGGVVAVGVFDQVVGTETLHLIVESDQPDHQRTELQRAVTAAVSQRCGVAPAAVHVVPRRSIVRTSSGKTRRLETRRVVLTRDGARRG